MVHIVVFEDSVSEDPKVVNTRNEVDNAKRAILVLADICQQIFTSDLYPVSLYHDPDIHHLFFALRIKDTVFLVDTSSVPVFFG